MINNQKIACVIPARGGSKGIPNKNIIDFCGKPLLQHSIEQAHGSKYIDTVFVSSDSEKILKVSKKAKASVIVRPINISTDNASSESAILHALKNLKEEYDIIVFLQATSPLRISEDIDKCIEEFIKNKYDSLFSACLAEDFLMWENTSNGMNSINYDYKNRKRRQDKSAQYIENGSIYVFNKQGFIKNNNRLFGKIGISTMETWKMFEIDNKEDLELCQNIYKLKIEHPKIGNLFDKKIYESVQTLLNKNKFPDYDNICTDSFAELIDKLCITHIRYWYLEDAMASCKTDEELLVLRKKSESLFKEKRPMLVDGIDKFLNLLIQGKIKLNPLNVKHYKGWKQKEIKNKKK